MGTKKKVLLLLGVVSLIFFGGLTAQTELLTINASNSEFTQEKTDLVTNAGFETGNLQGWNQHWKTRHAFITEDAFSGQYAVKVGSGRGFCLQEIKVKPNSLYRITAYLKTNTGAEEVQLSVSDYGGPEKAISIALTDYTKVSIDFQTAFVTEKLIISIAHLFGHGHGYADDIQLTYLGDAPELKIQEFVDIPERVLKDEGGVAQLPDEIVEWFQNERFGMFIHWGVYAAMDEGSEWVRHNMAWGHEFYQRRARDPEMGFTASEFDASQWTDLAKKAGMKYVVLTARHHDGYSLFDSKHPYSWTSQKDLGRDLIKEYVTAVRASGLHVGMYYSPMSWRYPGYYDVTGEDAKPNVWGYKTAAWHKADARDMKEEVYEQVTTLLKDYGQIDYMFWDGGWLGQTVDHEMERYFWDSGKYQNPDNEWPIKEKYITRDDNTGKALGIMGLVRRYQPDMLVNERFSWIGDVHGEEGGSMTTGDIRFEQLEEKCVSLQKGGWGYLPDRPVFSFEEVVGFLSNCAVRNMNLLLNVAPDREGVIPQNQQEVLLEVGSWLGVVGEAIYGTTGGPWQPLFGEYGFTFNDNKIYCHIYKGYRALNSGTFTTQSLGDKTVCKVLNLFSGEELTWVRNENNTVTINGVDHSESPAATILEITLNHPVF